MQQPANYIVDLLCCCTQGKLRLVSSQAAEGNEESEVLRLAAAVEGSTRHPLADAVLLAAHKAHLQVHTHFLLASLCIVQKKKFD